MNHKRNIPRDKVVSRELAGVGVNPEPPKGSKNGPEHIREILPAVMRDIEKRIARNGGQK